MQNSHTVTHGQQIEISAPLISAARQQAGRGLIIAASLGLGAIIILQSFYAAGAISTGFENWRPVLYAYVLWAVALGVGQVMVRGEAGHRALFLLPALLFTIVMVIFPTFFGIYIAFTDWNLSAFDPPKFNGFDNFAP